MKLALTISLVYSIALTTIAFTVAGVRTSALIEKKEKELGDARAHMFNIEPVAKTQTFVVRDHIPHFLNVQEDPPEAVLPVFTQPADLVATVAVSACNPRFHPCF